MKTKRRVYVIAEVGINHNGSLPNCYKLIDVAVNAGCDCVKFQFFEAKSLYPRSAGKIDWQDKNKKYSYDIYKAVETFELPAEWIAYLIKYCNQRKIDFLSSIFEKKDTNYLISRGIKALKIASTSITNLLFIEHCARYKIPIIISTGGATLGEIEEAVRVVNRYHNKLALLHCSLKYPTEPKECNLGVIETLHYAFPNNRIGYSDHTQEISRAAVQAIYLDAEIIEKHITLDKKMQGPDHFFALEPQELKIMVEDIRKAEKDVATGNIKIDKKMYGSSAKVTFEHESYLRNFCFMTLFAARDIKKGKRIRYQDLFILRPGKKERGLDPKYLDLFNKYKIYAAENIDREEAITWRKIFNA